MKIRKSRDLNSAVYKDGLKIRQEVFMQEQKVPLEIEIDDQEEHCLYFTLYTDAGEAIATSRIFTQSQERDIYQRIAVLKPWRRKGIGSFLLTAMEVESKITGRKELSLGAQVEARGFYESLGFEAYGDYYYEANIKHIDMKKKL